MQGINIAAILLLIATLQRIAATKFPCVERQRDFCVIENVTVEDFPSALFPPETSLLIQNSTISDFGGNQFRSLPTVENLMIHHLQIEQLTLSGCDQLLVLFASFNHISEVSVDEGLPLRSLHIYQNLLTNITALGALTQLEQLYLNDNLLEVIEMSVFGRMKNLKILTLHRNRLTAIDTGYAVHLPSLESLFLQHNKLMYLDTGLWKMPVLRKLDVSDNELGYMFTFLEEFVSLAELELHDNRWNCAWLYKMMDRMETRGIQHRQPDQSCEGTLLEEICCSEEAATPDPMMLLISRATLVDDLQDQLGSQRQKIEWLEETHRKQTHKFDDMMDKISEVERLCRKN